MKKVNMIFFTIIVCLMCSVNVSAKTSKSGSYFNCSDATNQCISCTYDEVTYYVKADGNGSGSVAWETNSSNQYANTTAKNASFSEFCTDNCSTLKCVSSFYKYPDTQGNITYTTKEPNTSTKANISLSNSNDNGKSFISKETQDDINNGKKYTPRTCTYYTYITKQGSSTPTKSSSRNFSVSMDADGNFSMSYNGSSVSNASSLAGSGNITTSKFSEGCPSIYVSCPKQSGEGYICSASTQDIYQGKQDSTGKTPGETDDDEPGTSVDLSSSVNCGVFGDVNDKSTIAFYLNRIFNIIKFLGPVLVLVTTIVDLVKSVAAMKQDGELQKLGGKTLKRVFYAALLFIIPSLINLIFNLVGLYGTCGIK